MSFTVPARRLTIVLFAFLLAALGAPTIASAAAANPVGQLESVQATAFSNTVVMNGWALDPSARSRPTSVEITVDGTVTGGWRPAGVTRADVNSSQAATGGHGFSITTTPAPGSHTVCVTARKYAAAAPTTSLGCFAFRAYPAATKTQMNAIAKTIDPERTIAWSWTALPMGTSGQALPWNSTILIGSGDTTRYLRAVMLHEWSHVLQYRAFAPGDPWWDAVQAFNALLGHPADRRSYDGVEHGADCIASALGADYLSYGCPAAQRVYGARIARGDVMNQPTGRLDSATRSGSVVTLTGWALDPSNPTTASPVRVIDNGRAVTGWTATTLTRADVNTTLGVTGRHGFTTRLTLAKGSHRLCLSAAPVVVGRSAATAANCMMITIT